MANENDECERTLRTPGKRIQPMVRRKLSKDPMPLPPIQQGVVMSSPPPPPPLLQPPSPSPSPGLAPAPPPPLQPQIITTSSPTKSLTPYQQQRIASILLSSSVSMPSALPVANDEHSNTAKISTTSKPDGFMLPKKILIFLIAMIVCILIGISVLTYHFTVCSEKMCTATVPPDVIQHKKCINSLDDDDDNDHHTDDLHINEHNNVYETISDDLKPIKNQQFDLRLPKSIKPILYDIYIIPFIMESNFTFSGEIKIIIDVLHDCNNITLHAHQLNISADDVEIMEIQNYDEPTETFYEPITIREQYLYEKKQFYIIHLNEQLTHNRTYQIFMKFNGILNDHLQGFYRSSYTLDNTTRWIAATQFQPTDARRAFPCFDEPALKAKFIIQIAHHKNMTALSNMPKDTTIETVDGLPDYVLDIFKESVPMSTYLVAYTVMDLKSISLGRLNVWARNSVINSAKFASEIAVKLLSYYEEFFQINFPIPKLDMIALPDFMSGAMENWGLITFRETTMLYDELVSTRFHQQRVSIVIAHEISHQWFGNLVTPSWWSDLWLNEGFATYLEYVGVDAIKPKWKIIDQLILENQAVFLIDALANSRQLHIDVENPDELNEIFDRISYSKGAAIIRMMDHFLTAAVFKEGLNQYLIEKKYDVADQEDLWHYLTLAAHKNNIFDKSFTVKEIMDTWTLQTGYPVVTVTRQYNGNTSSVIFQQKRFMYINGDKKNPIWWIPITFTTTNELDFNNTKPSHWMRGISELQIDDLVVRDNQWLLLNIKQTGFYRVNYDDRNWHNINSYLSSEDAYILISVLNRAQLIDDSMNLARAGLLKYDIALNLTKYLEHETDYIPWKTAIHCLNYIESLIGREAEFGIFQKYYLSLLENIYNIVGFNEDKITAANDMILGEKRIEILTVACHLEMRDCVDKCQKLFKSWMESPDPDKNNPISPDLRPIVYCTAIRNSDYTAWDFLWDRLQNTTVPSEHEILLSALGCTDMPWILSRYLHRAFTGNNNIRKHDVIRVFVAVANSYIGQFTAFTFLQNEWKLINNYLHSAPSIINPLAAIATRRMNHQYELDEFITFAKTNLDMNSRLIQQSIEIIQANVIWKKRHFKIVANWLKRL